MNNNLYINNIEYLSNINNKIEIDICVNDIDFINYIQPNLPYGVFNINASSRYNINQIVEFLLGDCCVFSWSEINLGKMKFSLDYGRSWILETDLSSKEKILNNFNKLVKMKSFI